MIGERPTSDELRPARAEHASAPRLAPTGRVAARRGALPAALALFALALAPRAVAIGRFLTMDEAYHWFDRARLFLRAIRAGDWAATNLVGHPGVTTMWLGAIGLTAQRALSDWGLVSGPAFDVTRVFLRLPVAIVTSICVALAYVLLRRLVGARLALLGALLWAGDPFLVAHSQILHVDALLTSFMTLSLLLAMLAFRLDDPSASGTPRWGFLAASGVAAGLALLTKSPSVVLAPAVALVALAGLWRAGTTDDRRPARSRSSIVRRRSSTVYRFWSPVVLPLLAWGLLMLLVWYALWPAAWRDPIGAIGSMIRQARDDGTSPHGWGNFFLGRAVADPGLLFYPVATALRLTPWALVGLVAAAPAGVRAWRRGRAGQGKPLIVLAIFCVLFTLVMTAGAKKFDRYMLPIFPALDAIAAYGLLWLWDGLRSRLARGERPRTNDQGRAIEPAASDRPVVGGRRLAVVSGWAAVVLVLAGNLALHHPYEMAYYNQLLGGGPVAVKLIPVGWGEGLEQAGDFIRSRPTTDGLPVATWYWPVMKPYVSTGTVRLSDAQTPGRAGYAVLYIDQEQRRDDPETTDMLRARLRPIRTVRINGIDYATIYQLPQPVAHPVDADFGPAIHLRGFDADMSSAGAIALAFHWEARAVPASDYMLFVHVLAADGRRVGQADIPLGDPDRASTWLAGSYTSQRLRLPLAAGTPPGAYWVAIGVYDPRSGARLTLRAEPRARAPDDGTDALLLGPVRIGKNHTPAS